MIRRLAPQPIVFAHRGAHQRARENTISAFQAGINQGATGLESDVWLASDGVPVLVHDGTVVHGTRQAPVTAISSVDLERIGIPTLNRLYGKVTSEYELSLDLKDPAALSATLDVAAAANRVGHLWVCHPSIDVLVLGRDVSHDVRLVCTPSPSLGDGALEAVARGLSGMAGDALSLYWRTWTPALVEMVHGAGLLAFGYHAHTAEGMTHLIGLRVDGIYTDDVPELLTLMSSFGPDARVHP